MNNKLKKIISGVAISMLTISLAGCNLIAKTPEGIRKSPVAKVKGEVITKGELDNRMKGVINSLKAQYGDDFMQTEKGKQVLEEQKSEFLNNLVMEKVILQKAKELKLIPEKSKLDKEVEKKLNDTKKAFKDEKQFTEGLKQYGFTLSQYKDAIKDQIIESKVYEDVVKNVKVDEKEAKKFYEANPYMFTEKPNKIHLAHIIVKDEAQAKKVKSELDAGAKFEDLAKKYGTDGTKNRGGDLGEQPYVGSNLDKTFMDAGLKLKDGEVSGVVKTQFGYHLIKCIKKTEYPVKKFETVKDQLIKQLEVQKKNEVWAKKLQEWKKEANIKLYEKNM